MSLRSFRDRYNALDQQTTSQPEERQAAPDWPLPAGGTLHETSFGHTVRRDALFDGNDIELARHYLDASGVTPDISSTLFIDTETTGLAGGTGTHVFLVGIGRFEGGRFLVRQYFLRHPGEERALLDAIERDVRDSSCIVTYNGRTFDIPMLETRFRMHHHACTFPDLHLDLLHPARSVWKHRLPSCSLGTIEQHILGVTRVDDAPGWLIPQLYFTYLQSRNVNTLHNVFNHNQQDIVSLARIAGLVHAYQAGITTPDHPSDRLGIALMQLRYGDPERAIPVILDEAGSPLIPSEFRFRAVREASIAMKRAGWYDRAVPFWNSRLNDPSRAIRLFVAEELAKFYEHRERNNAVALALSLQALDGAQLAGDHEAVASFRKRIARLRSKLYRTEHHVFEGETEHL